MVTMQLAGGQAVSMTVACAVAGYCPPMASCGCGAARNCQRCGNPCRDRDECDLYLDGVEPAYFRNPY